MYSQSILTVLKNHSAELPADDADLVHLAITILYSSLIAVAIFAQGGTALYYFSRQKYLQRYVQETPAWILEMQRAGGPL
jgi:mannose/fructose/N-acetylgalactosamine-specific phosphotransferase system component IIC